VFDPQVYRQRNVVARCFNRLKHWRDLATRFAKRATRTSGGRTVFRRPTRRTPRRRRRPTGSRNLPAPGHLPIQPTRHRSTKICTVYRGTYAPAKTAPRRPLTRPLGIPGYRPETTHIYPTMASHRPIHRFVIRTGTADRHRHAFI
jgi:hypothetical protein